MPDLQQGSPDFVRERGAQVTNDEGQVLSCGASAPGQLEIWFSAEAGADASCAYNETHSLHVKGPFNEGALVQALSQLAYLHPVLRGHFARGGKDFVIDSSVRVTVDCQDFSAKAAGEREDAVLRAISASSLTPYDLSQGPLYRPSFLRLSPDHCVIVLGLHQAICDELSVDLLLSNLTQLYDAGLGFGTEPAPSAYCFNDYLSYCRTPRYLQEAEANRRYWKEHFGTLPPDLELPYDGRRPKLRSYAANHVTRRTSFDVQALVAEFSQSEGISPTVVYLAALGALLHRISGANDLLVGVPIPGQLSAGMADCVGQFTDLVPIRFAFTSEVTFLQLCQNTNLAVREAQAHSTAGFSQLVTELNVQRDPARIPLVSVTYAHTVKPVADKIRFRDCTIEYEINPHGFEIFEFSLNVIESSERVAFSAHANAELYSRNWIERRLNELERLLSDGCHEPAKAVDRLTLLSYGEFLRICQYSNNFGQEYARDQIVSNLFETQAFASPDAMAVQCGARQISYLALEHRANQLAHALRHRGVGRGKIVGICLNRDIDMVATVLAVHKAGAAYVPLDPAFPPGRLRHMIEDSGLCLVVSESVLASCHTCPPDKVLNLDEQSAQIAIESVERIPCDSASAQVSDTAYLIYTSGSTGMPKGVCVPHSAAVNFLASMREKPGLSAQDRLLAVTTLSFDIALLELLLPLSVGGTVILASRDEVVDGMRLLNLLETTHATIMQATPVSWRLLLEAGWQGNKDFKALCGGEPLPIDLAQALLKRVGQLWNMYGPTETTVWSTCCQVLDVGSGITVGRPINNTSVWVLDSKLQPCPIGVPGEIHIGGDGVATGYFNRPELTRERFIANPYSRDSESRLYKTGDSGRWRDNGELECLGRTDSQVKIRGFRIELGEIEALLSSVSGVKKAAVIAGGRPGNAQLIAYLVPESNYGGDASSRETLKKKLPDYMVPAIFVHLSEFPLTPNGKLDRKALPEPNAAVPSVENLEPPSDEMEASLLDLWQTELGRSPISVTANFFELGGHSLLAIRIFNVIYQKHQVRLHIATLIEYPTVRQLSQRICELTSSNQANAEVTWSTVVPIQPRGELPPLFCVAGLGGNPINLRFLAQALRMNQPFYGLQHRGVDGNFLPHRDMEAMAEEFLEDIRKVQRHGPYYLAGYSTGGVAAYELARLLVARGESVDALVLLDTYNPTCLTWSLKARVEAHLERIKSTGISYVWNRAAASIAHRVGETRRSWRARLAQRNEFEYRQEAVVEATLEAERKYVPRPIAADIHLVKADFSIPELEGIGYPPHESNGWREIDHGNLKTTEVQCNHEDLVSEQVAPTTGTIVRHILRTAQAKRASEKPPPPSVMPNWLKSGNIPYYVPKGVVRPSGGV